MKIKISKRIFLFLSLILLSSHSAKDSHVAITADENYRYIDSNGLPNHETGNFPKENCPNTITEQNYSFRVPLNPKFSGKLTPSGFGSFGVALNGVVFDPKANEFWNNDRSSGWNYNPASPVLDNFLGLDQNNAHVQPNGAYHYHGLPKAIVSTKKNSQSHSSLIGFAADGFPIYANYGYKDPHDKNSGIKKLTSSYRLKNGTRDSGPGGKYDGSFVEDYEYVSGAGDLDEANGRIGVTPEYPNGTYYYVLTEEFPYVSRYFKGTPDSSFLKKPNGGMQQSPREESFNEEDENQDQQNNDNHHDGMRSRNHGGGHDGMMRGGGRMGGQGGGFGRGGFGGGGRGGH